MRFRIDRCRPERYPTDVIVFPGRFQQTTQHTLSALPVSFRALFILSNVRYLHPAKGGSSPLSKLPPLFLPAPPRCHETPWQKNRGARVLTTALTRAVQTERCSSWVGERASPGPVPVSAGAFQHGKNVKAARLLKTEAKRLSRSPLTTSRFAARAWFSLSLSRSSSSVLQMSS